jgi:hypothetical protein
MGTRISEESYLRPEPMIEIGGKPILWRIAWVLFSWQYFARSDRLPSPAPLATTAWRQYRFE